MKELKTQVLVIGSGIAGLYYAIRCAAFASVTIVTKAAIGDSNTMFAQGGIAAVMDKNDNVESHVRDTLSAGDGLCKERAVRLIAENAKQAILDLENLQVQFDKTPNGDFDLHREGGHSYARVVHHADITGREVENSLVEAVLHHPNIAVLERCFAVDLIVNENSCSGIIAIDENREWLHIQTLAVMLATGGAAQVYKQTTNPAVATGDGFAMAHRAGARVSNMEFVQFHPTTLYEPGCETFLITEAIRGFGAELKDKDGQAFMHKYHPMKSLAPRDVVSRAIINEMQSSDQPCVYLDVRNITMPEMQKHFPNIAAHCERSGLNLSQQMIPVVPAAHYMCGGVVTDLDGKTSVANLYASGEVACTGVHGANRLASNSLLEGLVFAARASNNTGLLLTSAAPLLKNTITPEARISMAEGNTTFARAYMRDLMWQYAGIIRNHSGLTYCLNELNELKKELESSIMMEGISLESQELSNMLDTSMLIVMAALNRKESRGCHYRTDFPEKNDPFTTGLQIEKLFRESINDYPK